MYTPQLSCRSGGRDCTVQSGVVIEGWRRVGEGGLLNAMSDSLAPALNWRLEANSDVMHTAVVGVFRSFGFYCLNNEPGLKSSISFNLYLYGLI